MTTDDQFGPLRVAVGRLVKQGYADGMRRAALLVSIAVGKLPEEDKQRLTVLLDQLEEEVLVAEDSASP